MKLQYVFTLKRYDVSKFCMTMAISSILDIMSIAAGRSKKKILTGNLPNYGCMFGL